MSKPGTKPAAPGWTQVWPGVALVGVAALAASFIGDHYGMPVVLAGLLIGFALSFVNVLPTLQSGLSLCATTGLRWGIVLLGTQITFAQFGALGAGAFGGLAGVMTLVILAGLGAARLSGHSSASGWIAGGATAICGASAAMAIYAVLGRERINQEQFTLTLVSIALASALATVAYPLIATGLDMSDRQAGFLMGAAIHDVAQALGAGFGYSQAAGEYATVVKLTRVALLAPVVVVIGMIAARGAGPDVPAKAGPGLPWFVIGFIVVVGLGSLVAVPEPVQQASLQISKALLLCAVIAAAISSRPQVLLQQGWKAILPVVGATSMALAGAIGVALVLVA